jgi:anti-sigma factor RsiW
MNHRPFEDWMLADQTLTPEQKRELQSHLRTCTQCAALAEVNLALHSARVVAPASGFAGRFQVRLAAQRRVQRKRNFWGFLILVISVMAVLLWLAWPVLEVVLDSPVDSLSAWLSYLLSLWFWLQALGQAGLVLLRVIPALVPPYVWALFAFALAGWSLLWVLSIWKFAKIPQGV